MKRSTLLASAGALALAATRPLRAQPNLVSLSLGLTSKTANEWPEYVADAQGFFAANGLKVEMIYTGSSAAGAQQLTAGALDISEISSTQAIEAIQGGAPITIVAQHGGKAPYLVLGKKGITSLAQLRGKTIIVGGPNDITRVFMDKVLSSAGLRPDDYTYTYAGATVERFAALNSGGVDAAILFPPFSYRAAGEGFPVLADVSRFFPTFLFDGFCVRTEWGKSHADLVTRYLRAYVQGVRWLYEPANRARAIALLGEVTNTKPEDAAQTYDLFVTRLHIFPANPEVTPAALDPVLDALVKIGQLKAPAPPAAHFYDNAYVAQALSPRRR